MLGYEPKRTVLEIVNFKIPEKDFVAVTGLNGSENSSLFHLILVLQEPLWGGVLIEGKYP